MREMQLKIETLEELQSEDDELNARSLDKILSRYSSLDSLNQDAYDTSDNDLDKLSICLSEASSESNDGGKRPSVFREVMQAQLALWTLIGSIFYSYVWRQHRKKFLFSLFVVVPPVILFCITISSLLTTIVILGRIFSTPLSFKDVLQFGGAEDEPDENKPGRHFRTLSINSYQSSVSGNSINDDYLPRPVCRKHSTSNGSLNQISAGTTSPTTYNGINGKSPPSHRLSYTFTHSTGGGDDNPH